MSLNWATYQSATGCVKYGPAGAQSLLVFTEDVFAELHRSMGICNCRSVAGGSSWSHHAECRAVDTGFTAIVGRTFAYDYAVILGQHGRRVGLDHLITNRKPWLSGRGEPIIFSAKAPNGRVYTGAHPHKDHNHNGLTRSAGRNLTYATLVDVYGSPASVASKLQLSTGGEFEMFCKKGDKGILVSYWQRILKEIDPKALPQFGVDGDYGDETAAWVGKYTSWSGVQLHAGEASQLHAKLAAVKGGGGGGGSHADSDHASLAPKTSVDSVANALTRHIGEKQTGPH